MRLRLVTIRKCIEGTKLKYRNLFCIVALLWGGWTFAQGLIPVQELPQYAPDKAASIDNINFDFHGGAVLWYYRPNQSYIDENFNINFTYVDFDAVYKNYGVHAEARFSSPKYRGYYKGDVWYQEAYGYYRLQNSILKIGKEYTHFGKFWDGSYYGNVLYYDGLLLNPDNGISWEGQLHNSHGWQANYYLQYFVIDGGTNGSLDPFGETGEGGLNGEETGDGAPIDPACINSNGNFIYGCQSGRDSISIPGAHRRNEAIARFNQIWSLSHHNTLTFGLNYEYLLADLSPLLPRRFNVNRYGVDTSFSHLNFSVFFEWVHQQGYTVTDYPLEDNPSKNIDYYWAGTSYKFGKYVAYFNYSDGFYHDEDIHDITEIPGVSYQLNKIFSGALEFANWYRTQAGSFSVNDNSLNLILRADI